MKMEVITVYNNITSGLDVADKLLAELMGTG